MVKTKGFGPFGVQAMSPVSLQGNIMFTSSHDINTIEQARAYLKRRAKDAVLAWRLGHHLEGHTINNPIELAKYIARFW